MMIASVVVTHNRLEQLRVTILRLLKEPVDTIIVVNNACTDGTERWLADQTDPRLHIVHLAENQGGAGGFEAGISEAMAHFDPTWIALMDDDARPLSGAFEKFRAQSGALGHKTGAVAAAVFLPDGSLSEINRPSRSPFWNKAVLFKTLLKGGRRGFHLDDSVFDQDADPVDVDVASFVGFFLHRDAVKQVGLPEGGLFIYGDDVLYSFRLRRAGIGITFLPSVRFEHDCKVAGEEFVYFPLWKIYYHCRNGVAIARQAAGPIIFPFALFYYTIIWWRRGFHYQPTERRQYRALMWAGLRDGLAGKRGRHDILHEPTK